MTCALLTTFALVPCAFMAYFTVYMDKTYGTKKYEADKIVFLCLFISALLIARLITSSRYTRPLKAGSKVVAEIKSRGINSFLSNQNRQDFFLDRKSTRLNSSHIPLSRMPSSA